MASVGGWLTWVRDDPNPLRSRRPWRSAPPGPHVSGNFQFDGYGQPVPRFESRPARLERKQRDGPTAMGKERGRGWVPTLTPGATEV